jgi:hypothetical protein
MRSRMRAMIRSRKVFQVVRAAVALVALGAWFYWGALENLYVSRPREPRPEAGLVVPYHVKGMTVYVTKGDQQRVTWVLYLALCSVAVFAVLSYDDIRKKLRGR